MSVLSITSVVALMMQAGPAVGEAGAADAGSSQSRTEASQIGDPDVRSSPFLTPIEAGASVRRRESEPRREPTQLSTGRPSSGATQISDPGIGNPPIVQLSKAELDATLAQLSAIERKVLFDAISGTDICDNPPPVAAIRTLCLNRIETRSSDFAQVERPLSSEELLLQGGFDNSNIPNVERVIERLARNSTEASDFNNQAIASVALSNPATTPRPPIKPEDGLDGDLTQEMVSAIVQQLGGGRP
jgi:hypothetical protein